MLNEAEQRSATAYSFSKNERNGRLAALLPRLPNDDSALRAQRWHRCFLKVLGSAIAPLEAGPEALAMRRE